MWVACDQSRTTFECVTTKHRIIESKKNVFQKEFCCWYCCCCVCMFNWGRPAFAHRLFKSITPSLVQIPPPQDRFLTLFSRCFRLPRFFFVVFQVAHTRFIWIDHGMRLTAWRWDATPPSCLGLCGEVANRRHPQSPTHEQWHHRLKLHTVVCRAVCGVSGRTRIERFDPNGTFNSFFAADLLTDETKHSGMSGLRSRTFRW